MSAQNVEIARRAYEAIRERDVEGALEYFDPEVIWEDLDDLPGGRTYRGHQGLLDSVRQFTEVWGDLDYVAEEFFDAGDSVVVASRLRVTGRASGTPIEAERWNVLTLRHGRIAHRRVFQDREAAFEAARGAT